MPGRCRGRATLNFVPAATGRAAAAGPARHVTTAPCSLRQQTPAATTPQDRQAAGQPQPRRGQGLAARNDRKHAPQAAAWPGRGSGSGGGAAADAHGMQVRPLGAALPRRLPPPAAAPPAHAWPRCCCAAAPRPSSRMKTTAAWTWACPAWTWEGAWRSSPSRFSTQQRRAAAAAAAAACLRPLPRSRLLRCRAAAWLAC